MVLKRVYMQNTLYYLLIFFLSFWAVDNENNISVLAFWFLPMLYYIFLTTQLNHTRKDFGCYEFKQNDFNVSYTEDDGLKKTLLKSGDIEFILGKRANPFIRRCFISTKLACLSNKKIKEVFNNEQ